ncbi:phage baseplate assembly protein V [Ruegeria sp. Ofav3-42]|uniref:phage baseplate assembly protein V n=1 Tax=Ruegeria sp. Ofav3-42 TaxID=2917759 RepID=UPI001EF60FE8|nr:phage baseplate assembly protein V [Ruegeria sp. Ofav3-42]MCG7518851.1 phage baseplate assembly protein V [Ruegeria sp. Ofav3-42]
MQSDQMKRGIVVEGRGSQVKVRFEDNDQVISGWLDVAQRSTAGMKVFTRPKPGSQVACLLDANRESGVVLGALYSDADPAPAGGDGTAHFEMPDGSTVIWEGGTFSINHASGIVLSISGGKLVVQGDLEVTGDLTVTGQTDLKATKINGITQVGD